MPTKGEVNRGGAYRKVPGGVLGPEGKEEGEGVWDSGRGRVGVRVGAGDPEGGKGPPVSVVGNNGARQGSRDRMEVGVEKRLLVVHLWTLCQKLSMPLSAV